MTKHIIICFGGRCRIIALPSSYNGLLKVARKQFPNMGSLYSLVALYQPEDFKATNDHTCWVELDETAYSTLHDRAVLHFNVQHAITKEYILPLPNSDQDIQPKSQVPPFKGVPLAESPGPSSTIDTNGDIIEEAEGGPANMRGDGDACASGWGGASERFRRSAKYIPDLQECKEAVRRGSGQLIEEENNEENEMAEQMNLGEQRKCEVVNDHENQGQYQDLEVCPLGCEHNGHCDGCQAQDENTWRPATQQTIPPYANGGHNDVVTHPQNHGEGQNAGWNNWGMAPDLAACTSRANNLNRAWIEAAAAGHTDWAPLSPMDFEKEGSGNPFDQSSLLRGRVADAAPGGWGPSPDFTPPRPSTHNGGYDQDAIVLSARRHPDKGFTWPSHQPGDSWGRQVPNFGDGTHASDIARTRFVSFPPQPGHPRPTNFPEASSPVPIPVPHMGRGNNMNEHDPWRASTWSPERQGRKQHYRSDQQQQSEEHQPLLDAAPAFSIGSPIRRGRTRHRPIRYQSNRNARAGWATTTRDTVPTVIASDDNGAPFDEQEASPDSLSPAPVSDHHDGTSTKCNAPMSDCGHRHHHHHDKKYTGHSSSEEVIHAARSSPGHRATANGSPDDVFWDQGQPPQRRGWGEPYDAVSFTDKGKKRAGVGTRQSWDYKPFSAWASQEGPACLFGGGGGGGAEEQLERRGTWEGKASLDWI